MVVLVVASIAAVANDRSDALATEDRTLALLAKEGVLGVADLDTADYAEHELPIVVGSFSAVDGHLLFQGHSADHELFLYSAPEGDLDQALAIREAWYFKPSSVPGRAWVADLDPDSPDTVRALSRVVEVTASGQVVSRDSPQRINPARGRNRGRSRPYRRRVDAHAR